VTEEPPRIAGPVANPRAPRIKPPPGAWDTHAHVFGPSDKFPYQPGRGYTPPDAPVKRFVALLDHLGFANGLVVQGNAHVYDNSVVLDALTRFPARLRGVAITDTRIKPEQLRDWHARGMRGLRFHLFPKAPNYIRGVGLIAANPERLMWGTDWPHPSIPADVMPDDGHLLDLFHDWTPDEQTRRRVLVDTPTRLFGR
jgi:predicted TIM-barrel fold metal-dependent hydrolase